MDLKKHAQTIVKKLAQEYPDAKCHIDFKTPFELLISTVLAAQCTDIRVNMVMVPLYATKYKTPSDVINSGYETFRDEIKSINFFNNKAKAVISICNALINEYNGDVPNNLNDLVKLAGVGRKSASVVLGNCFGKNDVIIVDTHLKRVAGRLGLISEEDPTKIEMELKKIIPENDQFRFSMRIGEHGRQICEAKKPKCNECFISNICPSYKILSLKIK